ncbi:homocitrate synthase [Acetobacterium paludosum]|uniref:Homocitrate synthase n=1 Tax=Acetobacterium paludosum TaxID=52693 RepID=A0A923HVS2_9FIRM|nr:homocitrate synthase [Acetobacterium paludosum]MBC3888087.1 homocitrate synthase [Acetobacterium paludosum]
MNQKYIVDTTLRDGEQSPGVAFTLKEKVTIAKALDAMGIQRIEAGTPAMGKEECLAFEKIKAVCQNAKIIGWNRMNLGDIQSSINCGADIIHVCVPSSDLLIREKLRKSRTDVLEKLEECADSIHSAHKELTIGLEDASRADWDFITLLIDTAIRLGATTLRFSDTVGIMTPSICKNYISNISSNIDIEVHMHNDLGMAVANSIQGLRSGAKYVDSTLFGIGERAGNCNLEHLLIATIGQMDFGICLDELQWRQERLRSIIFKIHPNNIYHLSI